jgi:NADH:ubiquinone reductase (H+-translocating)
VRIVCAGAGLTAIEVAPYLKRKLPNATVTIISKEIHHTLYSHVPELISGKQRIEDSTVNLEKYCANNNVEFIKGTINHINRETKTIRIGNNSVVYDYLLLDLGSDPDTTSVPGAEQALTIRGPLSMLELRQHIVTQLIKARNTNAPQHKAFVVIGAGVTGIEVATELSHLTEQACVNHLLFPEELATILVEHRVQQHHNWPNAVDKRIKAILETRNIQHYADTAHSYDKEGLKLSDRTIETQTIVWASTKRGNKLIETMGLELDANRNAVVNEYLQTSDPNIFAVGKNAALKYHKLTPAQAAFLSFDEQRTVANNIIALATGKKLHKYTPRSLIPIIITTGNNEALLVFGTMTWHGKTPYKLKQWFAKKYARSIENT